MTNRTIVLTGASDGIGAAAARQLHAQGHNLVLVGRSPAKTAEVARAIGNAPYHVADFADLAQVRELAATLQARYPRIDVLANNAGGIMGERTLTGDGFEKTFQVNHLAPFLLTTLLLPILTASNAVVIQTASAAAAMYGRFDVDDLQNANDYRPEKAYGNGKLANILFTRELDRRYRDQGISAVAFHPGVVRSSFASDTTHFMRYLYHTPLVKNLFTISADKGADQLVWLATTAPGTDWQRGAYYEKRKPAASSDQARDPALARQLWDHSTALLALSTP
ncbi:SDR family NAD(P)-dependent oxidoreductase [Nocardia sp. NPDC051787]|uniref:SDR family NAD(P)-dependent oxidoreductase n=1 Tax=Nocardia sp. NPDC051787 TaxID=3155415 RepID=UPI0034398130